MRPTDEQYKVLEAFRDEAGAKKISVKEQLILLDAIRNGDMGAIDVLVEHMEDYILSVIEEELCIGLLSVREMLFWGKLALIKLALHEVNSQKPERFFRYSGWAIQQEILERMLEENENWIEKNDEN